MTFPKASFKQTLSLERINDADPKYKDWYAILFGNTVLVGLMPDGSDTGNVINGVDLLHPELWIERLDGSSASAGLLFRATSANNVTQFLLRPLNEMLDERYTVYFDLAPLAA